MNVESFNQIAEFVVANLPDSVNERKRLLQALVCILPPKHPKRSAVGLVLSYLVAHQQQQLEFPLPLPTDKQPGREKPQ